MFWIGDDSCDFDGPIMASVRIESPNRRSMHGSILISVLMFVLITSIILAGIGSLILSDYKMSSVGSDYDNAIYSAEAGVNYELNKISANPANVDQKASGAVPGTSYTSTAGTFSVYVTKNNGDGTETTPWTAGSNLWVYSTGIVNGVYRQIKVASVGAGSTSSANYAAFGASQGILNGAPTAIHGDIGTNGFFTFNNGPSVTGNVIFNGSGSNWQSTPSQSYTVVYNANPVAWPTVETIAVNTFGSTGLSYVASNNDNGMASPVISSPNLLINSGTQTFVGKAGGANYYLTNLTCNGGSSIAFNNSAGPITIWFGPSGSSTTINFNGGTATVKPTTDTTKPVKLYIATTNDVQQNGNTEIDAGIYNLNNSNSGRVILNGSPTMYGPIISNMFTFNGNPSVYWEAGYFSTGGTSYYDAITPWIEIGGIY